MEIEELARDQDGLINATQCRALNIGKNQIRTWVRSGEWKVIRRGVYLVDADRRGDPTIRTLIRAAAMASGPKAVVVGRSAAVMHGIEGVRTETRPIELNLKGDRARPSLIGDTTVLIHQMVLPEYEVTTIDGVRVTAVVRTLGDLMLAANRYEAVAALDNALNQKLVIVEDLAAIEQIMAGRRGVVAAREWLDLADERAESPLETRSRLRCRDGGVPPDDLQVEILDSRGAFIARVDMLWRHKRLIAEADGASIHDTPEALFRDRERQNRLIAAGFAVIRFTWEDTMTPERIPMMVRRALASRIDHRD